MSIFGSSAGGSGGLFGANNTAVSDSTKTTQSSLFGSKPAAGGGLFGAAPAATSGTTGGLFGNAGGGTAPTTSGGLFGGPTSNTATNPASTNVFGSATPAPPATSPAAAPAKVFGSTSTTTPGMGLFANTSTTTAPAPGTTSTNSLYGGTFVPKPADPNAGKPAGTGLFGQPSTSIGATPASGGGLFGQFLKPTDSTTPASGAAPAPAPAGGLFSGSLSGKPAADPAAVPSSAPSTSTPAPPVGGLFGNLGAKPAEKKDGASPTATSAPAFGLFGAKPIEKKDAPAAAAPLATFSLGQPALSKPAEAPAGTQATLTAVAVAPPSMLKGKTIEEIVNKWSTELETHVREFNKFSGEVAAWDRALIENGNNLSSLYSHVLAAEQEQNDIDQSLDHVEQQQKELASTLDAYEKVTQEILGSQGGGLRALDTGPADTERDKNYMLATDLHTHLDDLSGSLTQMIDAVNALSLPSNDSDPADDPMAQIAQILSSHLESLQWIDGAVRDVESKVSDVEKRVKESGHSVPSTNLKSRGFGLNR
ncbi:hypothetical protein D9615_000270 [Tricholomella constricta]|uniref:Nucleoporin NSP1 n=1 Tax=Tricholomella constricta TaxID=117010 RepID=A0A8H5HQI7_9AGAR|nr:hypothetical protein D9615_000270 [Tricholomella constricta]